MSGARRLPSWAAVSGELPAKQRPLDNRSETPFFRSVVLLAKILFFLHESEKQDSENVFSFSLFLFLFLFWVFVSVSISVLVVMLRFGCEGS